MRRIVQCQGSHRCRERGAVENTKVFLGREGDGRDARRLQRNIRVYDLACAELVIANKGADGRIADEYTRNIGERRKI